MSDNQTSAEKSPRDTFDELRLMVTSYAKQETTEPLKNLGTWVGFGVAGAICMVVGTVFLSLSVLRFFQGIDWFQERDHLFTLPYLFAILVLLVATALAGLAAAKSFDD